MNSTLQVRIDKKMKKKAAKIFDEMGLDMSSAVKMFFRHVITTEALPFVPRTENGFTPVQEERILQEAAEAKRTGKVYDSIDDLHRDILGA